MGLAPKSPIKNASKLLNLALSLGALLVVASANPTPAPAAGCRDVIEPLISDHALENYMEMIQQSKSGFAEDFHSAMRTHDDRDGCYSMVEEALANAESSVPGEREYAIAHLNEYGGFLGGKSWDSDLQFKNYIYGFYEKSADQGYERARDDLFRWYRFEIQKEWAERHLGANPPEDLRVNPEVLEKAVSWMMEQAQAGDAEAQYMAGYILEYGLGREEDANQARTWYERAAATQE